MSTCQFLNTLSNSCIALSLLLRSIPSKHKAFLCHRAASWTALRRDAWTGEEGTSRHLQEERLQGGGSAPAPRAGDAQHTATCLSAERLVSVSSLGEISVQILCPFLTGLFSLLLLGGFTVSRYKFLIRWFFSNIYPSVFTPKVFTVFV